MNSADYTYGLLKRDINYLSESVKKFPEIEKAVIFGSRAMGNYKKGSDIDMAIFGRKVNFDITSRLSGLLNEELPIPYYTDVINFNTFESEELKQHILKKGKVLYKK